MFYYIIYIYYHLSGMNASISFSPIYISCIFVIFNNIKGHCLFCPFIKPPLLIFSEKPVDRSSTHSRHTGNLTDQPSFPPTAVSRKPRLKTLHIFLMRLHLFLLSLPRRLPKNLCQKNKGHKRRDSQGPSFVISPSQLRIV